MRYTILVKMPRPDFYYDPTPEAVDDILLDAVLAGMAERNDFPQAKEALDKFLKR